MKHTVIKQSHLPSLTKYLPNAVSTWTAACAQFQNPIFVKPFCCSLPCAFLPLSARQICDVVKTVYITDMYLNLIPYCKIKNHVVRVFFSWYKQYLIK